MKNIVIFLFFDYLSLSTQCENDNLCYHFADVSTFFTGGPVWAMEWCPIPMQVCVTETDSHVEYLAVSTHHSMDDTFCVSKCYSFPNVIQIWDCCSLSSERYFKKTKTDYMFLLK